MNLVQNEDDKKDEYSDLESDKDEENQELSASEEVEEVDEGADADGDAEVEGDKDVGGKPLTTAEDVDGDTDTEIEFNDEGGDEETSRSPRSMIVVLASFLILLLGISVGVSWYYFSDDESSENSKSNNTKVNHDKKTGPVVSLPIPPRNRKAHNKGVGLNQFLGSPSKLNKQNSGKGNPNKLIEPGSKGVFTPSEPSQVSIEKNSVLKSPKDQNSLKSNPSGNVAGKRALSSNAQAVGILGGRFGGKADPLGGALNAIGGQARSKGAGIVVPSVTSVTLRSLPDHPGGKPLGPTPVNTLIEKKEGLTGFLPKAGKGDDVSWKVYSRPYNWEEKEDDEEKDVTKEKIKRVAVVVMGIGLSKASSMAAIKKLPPEISLALDPYAPNLSDWLVRSRLVGHEVLLTLPMESEQFPVRDAGPYALKTSLNKADTVKRLEMVLSQVTGYFGVATVLGSGFGDSRALMTLVLNNLKDRGLMLLTTGAQNSLLAPKIARKINLPLVIGDVTLDAEPSPAGIQKKLRQLEKILKEKKIAVAIAQPYPASLRRLIAWIKTLEGKNITLVPVSALINKQIKKNKSKK